MATYTAIPDRVNIKNPHVLPVLRAIVELLGDPTGDRRTVQIEFGYVPKTVKGIHHPHVVRVNLEVAHSNYAL
jgi:hypothetical protein